MAIHWSLPLLESLLPSSLCQKLQSAQPDPSFKPSASDRMCFLNGQTGELLKELPTEGMRRFSRRKLRNICATNIEVVYGKTLEQILYNENGTGVTACFSDKTQATGTTLIGTDGPRSKTRELLLGPEISSVKPSGFILLSVTTSYTASQATYMRSLNGLFASAFHPNSSYYLIFPQDLSSQDPEQWTWQLMHSSVPRALLSASPSERLSYLKTKPQSSELVEPFRSAIEQIPEGTMVFCDELVCWESVPFDSQGGMVTLAGDAAHPMTPQRGQGLNHAICDVANLVKQLCEVRDGAKGLEEAIESYGTEMVARGSEEVRAALLVSPFFHFDQVFMLSKFSGLVKMDKALVIGKLRVGR